MIIPLIMSGGSGTRLWPLSRADNPKQFHALVDDRTMFAHTLARVSGQSGDLKFGDPAVVLNAAHVDLARRDLTNAGIRSRALVLEPFGRNTAPAVAAAILATDTADKSDLMLMLPADHLIANVAAFHEAITAGAESARDGAIVTFGIVPDRPETGFGYIHRAETDGKSFRVQAFVEKPDLETAERYLASGQYDWNAGIFLFRTDIMAGEIRRQRPAMWDGVEAAIAREPDEHGALRLDPESFAKVDGESLDYAVMENAARVNVVPVDMGWDDIGSWSQLHAASEKDSSGNTCKGDVIAIDAEGSYLRSEHGLLAAVGVKDVVVVQTGDATVVVDKARVQDVKSIVDALKSSKRLEGHLTRRAHLSPPPARERLEEVRTWLFKTALPFWAEATFAPTGGITETLDLNGAHPSEPGPSRLRVWARQIYVFAHAKLLGWDGDADAILDRIFSHLETQGQHPEGGWVHICAPDGSVIDGRRDSYDHAFVLLALAYMHKATGRGDVEKAFARTIDFLDEKLADARHGGYFEAHPVPGDQPRRANPHMHLLEAWLASYELTGDPSFLRRADKIVDLFDRRFVDEETWTLTEFFGADWCRLADERGRIAEPGHHYEWIWLLQRYAKFSGRSRDAACRKLFAFAEAYGRNRVTGLVYDEVTKAGRPITATSRCWPQTEALKALLALDRAGMEGLAPRIDETLSHLLDRTLADAPAGCWMDRYGSTGRPIADTIPASTFYHLFCAFAELLAHEFD